jgi:hypothetical protein
VIGCGARAFTGLRLAACFARPHRCAARVDRDAALAIAGSLSPSHDEMFLRWSARAEQFEWVVGQWQGGVYREVMRIGAHAPAKPERPRERR